MSPAAVHTWVCEPFDGLSPRLLYDLLKLRADVFVLEQQCLYADLDGADAACHHLYAVGAEGQVVASARLVPAGLKFHEASIGRVVTAPSLRGLGLGHALMARACAEVRRIWGEQPIRIGAQAHLQSFYAQHGFATVSPPYDEDGIAHVEMLRPHTTTTT